MDNERLRLHVASDSRDINAEAFLKVLGTTIDVLKEIDKQSSRFGGENVEWLITDAGKNSPLFAEIAGTGVSEDNGQAAALVINTFVAGLSHLEQTNTCPDKFNERSLDATADLTRSFSRGITSIEFAVSSRRVSLSPELIQNARYARQRLDLERGEFGATYREHGSVEGRLRQLETLSGERRDKLVIEDDLTGEKISCYFRDAEIEKQARKAWKRRVSVSGEITVDRASGNPASVLIEDIQELRERAGLPQLEDLYGIDITHGVESSKYIEGLRNAE